MQRLQETLGHEAASNLFAWFDEAGWVNRGAVREIADLYFERFDARLEQRLAEIRAELLKWKFIFWAGTIVPPPWPA